MQASVASAPSSQPLPSPTSQKTTTQPPRNIGAVAQNSLERAIASAPKTPNKKPLENGVTKNIFRKMETTATSPQPSLAQNQVSPFHVRNIEAQVAAERSKKQSAVSPSSPQNTLPAVQDFLQMAFDTVQRSQQPARPDASQTAPASPSSSAAGNQPSLLGPFPSTQNLTKVPATAGTDPPKLKKLVAKRTEASRSVEHASGTNETKRPSTSQGISRSQSYPGYIFYNSSLQNQKHAGTSPKRSILVAKRHKAVVKAASESGSSGEEPAGETNEDTPEAEDQNTMENKKSDQKGKQNSSSRVAQTYRELKELGPATSGQGSPGKGAPSRQGSARKGAPAGQPAGSQRNWRRNKNVEPEEDLDPKIRVLVSGFPAYTQCQDLVRVLSPLGACAVESCRNRLAVVRFERPEQARAARAARDLVIYGELLDVRPYTNPRHVDELYRSYKKVISTQKGEDITMPSELDLSGDFFQQMEAIEAAIRLSREQQEAVARLYADLEAVLQTEWPGCRAVPFGSIPAGLGIKSSDADCFVRLPGAGAGARGAAFVARARRLLARYPALFAQLVAIPRANTPIVKFRHVPSGFHCDVSAKTPLGARNSELVRLLLASDARLPHLALLVKYWAKVHGLSGTGRLTNYALILMLVFYLQRPPALLPPVARLQRPPAEPFLVDGWDAGFAPRVPPPAPGAAERALPELLGGFFDFYAAFDFDALVVCPLLGEPVPKAAFEAADALPPALARYAANVRAKAAGPLRLGTAFCVQDPFELSHNVACAVSARLAADVRACLAAAAAVPPAQRAAALPRAALAPRPPRAPPAATLQLLPRLRLRLPEPEWREPLRAVLLHDIFRDMLLLRLRRAELDEAEASPRRRGKYDRERYRGAASKPVWRRRRAGAAPPGASPAAAAAALRARQAALSAELARAPRETSLEFELELWFREEPRHCSLSLRMLHGDLDAFQQLVSFVHTAMVDWFRVLIRPHLAEDAEDVARRLSAVALEPRAPEPRAPQQPTVALEPKAPLEPRAPQQPTVELEPRPPLEPQAPQQPTVELEPRAPQQPTVALEPRALQETT